MIQNIKQETRTFFILSLSIQNELQVNTKEITFGLALAMLIAMTHEAVKSPF